jgi:hypothetical protein
MHISPGNRKLGTLPSVSLPPIVTCNCAAGCTRGKLCYAVKMKDYAIGVWKSWANNYRQWLEHPAAFRAELRAEFETINAPRYFRWFVGGDCPDPQFWALIIETAKDFPSVRFLLFTKQYSLIKGRVPANLEVVVSSWPGLPIPAKLRRRFRVAWYRDPENLDPRIPDDALECPGGCDHCGMCWSLGEIGRDVVFDKH